MSKRTEGKAGEAAAGGGSSEADAANHDQRVEAEVEKRRTRLQRPFPACAFEEALEFATSIMEFGSGQQVRRVTLFDHLKKSPESGASRQLITNANKYGLTEGSYKAEFLKLTQDGLKSVDEDVSDRERGRARISLAIEGVEAFNAIYKKFLGNKLPPRASLIDAAKDAGIPEELAEEAVDTFVLNLRFVGLLQTLSGAERIVSVEHYLDSLSGVRRSAIGQDFNRPVDEPKVHQGGSLVTAARAEFETTCFYITAIGEEGSEQRKHSDLFVSAIVEPALEPFGLKLIRADAIDKPGTITRQIIDYILQSRLVIADLSFHNPNVFYELAIRHAARLPVVQIARTFERLPFDVNQMRTIRIDTTDIYTLVPKMETHRAEISSQVRRALEDPESVDNPITIFYPSLRMTIQ
ncbi:hypothetical protein [Dyella thiooxydans]|uniref:hypothetical protein n=1 Tax=Dyella thiooxydans TaxID=445710 RepID=UPI0007C54FAC|nr:hypothetical protein [Dyella thiooxydans]